MPAFLRGKTLGEKQNGTGFRDRLVQFAVRVVKTCQVDGCYSRTTSILTLYVDAHPPGLDWYAKLLRTLTPGCETEVGVCASHARAILDRDEELMMNPALWEPGRMNPPVLPGPGRLLISGGGGGGD